MICYEMICYGIWLVTLAAGNVQAIKSGGGENRLSSEQRMGRDITYMGILLFHQLYL